MVLCVGSSTKNRPKDFGLRLFSFDKETGQLTLLANGAQGRSPTFAVFGNGFIYAVDEQDEGGGLDAYTWNGGEKLEHAGGCDLPGNGMCHVALWPDGRHLSAANYNTGSLVVCKLDNNGIPESLAAFEQHKGVGYDSAGRQEGPHTHFSAVAPGNDRLFVTDLGLDWVSVYRIDNHAGTLVQDVDENQVYTPLGAGPRHLAFSADGQFWYLVTELDNRVFVYSYDKATGRSRPIGNQPMLPQGFDGFNIASDIQLSPDGRFLYAANRGRNEVVCFSVDADTGNITFCERYDAHCDMPRTFVMNDAHLVVAGQGNGKVVVLRRDAATGALGDVICEVDVPGAAFVGFLPSSY